jgi:hypothetical protein
MSGTDQARACPDPMHFLEAPGPAIDLEDPRKRHGFAARAYGLRATPFKNLLADHEGERCTWAALIGGEQVRAGGSAGQADGGDKGSEALVLPQGLNFRDLLVVALQPERRLRMRWTDKRHADYTNDQTLHCRPRDNRCAFTSPQQDHIFRLAAAPKNELRGDRGSF